MAAEADPALADLAGVSLMLATPEPPRVAVVVEYEVTVNAGEVGETAARLSSMDRSIPTATMATLAGISIAEVVAEDGSAIMICVQTSCAAYEPSEASAASTPIVRAPCDASACSPATHALKRDVTGLLCAGARCVEGGDDQTLCCDALPQSTEDLGMTG